MKDDYEMVAIDLEGGAVLNIMALRPSDVAKRRTDLAGPISGTLPGVNPARPATLVTKAQLDGAMVAVEAFAGRILETIRKAKPTKASIEFSVAFGLESGTLAACIVKGHMDADFKITLEWSAP